MKNPKFAALGLLGLVANAHAALYYNDLYTDGSGFVSPNAGWSGDGTVQTNVGSATPTANTFDVDLLTGFTGGTLSLGETRAFVGASCLSAGLMGTMDIQVGGGGTADLNLDSFWGSAGRGPNNFGIHNFSDGANSLVVEFQWSEPIGMDINSGVPVSNAPFLAALQGIGASSAYDVSASYSGLVSSTTGTVFQSGVPGGAPSLDMTNSNLAWPTGSTSTSATGIALPNGRWQGINGYDMTGGTVTLGAHNNGVFEDEELVYASGIRFEISRSDGQAFDPGSQFVFSTNGNQWKDTLEAALAVPEPSRAALVLLGTVSLLFRRRR